MTEPRREGATAPDSTLPGTLTLEEKHALMDALTRLYKKRAALRTLARDVARARAIAHVLLHDGGPESDDDSGLED